ncbi:leucine-rich repeat flightless-interacting protein 1-like isoform X11 [Dendropsophus ebraccatus]|uniref:leucine-rich repeat flightless-interacting protein 1-like isoform X11 n=1 Tax=Dendropsophus ebraccatus TaxID=150705 RepID=UPI0038319A53
MGTQGPGRKRHPNREKLSAEDHALNQIAREAEARLAAKRAARAEAREIRMKELERQQKEIYQVQKKYYGLDTKWGDIEQWMEDSERYSHKPRRNLQASDEDDVMSVTSRSSLRTNGYEDELLGAAQYRKSSRSSTGSGDTIPSSRGPPRDESMSAYYSDLSLASAPLTAKSLQQSVHNGSRPSLLNCNSLPSRSQRGSLYDEGVTSGSRRSSSSRPPSEYSCYLGSGSRASSRASSARASPVSSEPTGPPLFRRGSASGSVHSQSHLEDVSVTSGSRIEERPDKDFAEKSGRPASSLSAATLASLGGTSSRRGSGDTSISVDTEASIREIKEISELKEQIEDVEGKYMQGLKEMKDSLAEVEEKYKRSMVTNAQLDNEKTSLQYQVDTLREVLLEMEEELAESRRQYEDKQKECERQKHEQGVLRFQLAEMKEALEQREALLTKNGIALDSDSTLNGDASIEHHVNSDGPPDPPVRAVSMGKPEGTVERKEAMSMVGESPPRTEQDRQEIAQDAEKEMSLHAEGEDVSHKHNEEENNSGTSVESKSVEVCSHHKSETSMEEQKEELGSEEDKEMSGSEVVENISEVDGENTVKRSDVSPSGSEVFQDAIDFVETPSTINEVDEDVTSVSDPLKEEPKVNQPETVAKADDQCTMGGAPEEGAETTNENTANICENNESNILEGEQDSNNSSSSQEDISTETSEYTSSNENIALEQEVPVVEELKPLQSQEPESGSETIKENMGQSKNDGISSAAENTGDDDDQSKLVSADEKPSPDALITSDDLAAQVGKEETSDVSESSAVTERKSITEDESIKDHVIPEDSCSQDEQEPVQEDERQGDVLKGEELKVVDQREEDTLSGDLVSGNIKNETNTVADKAESPKESVPPETFSSEGESTQEDEETDDDDGTVRSEKYTGESEIPHASLGSSVDGQSLEDIRMEDGSEKSPRRGKGKNKEDCVLS